MGSVANGNLSVPWIICAVDIVICKDGNSYYFCSFSGFVKMAVNCYVVIHVHLLTTHSASIHHLQTFLMVTGSAQDVR
jgi:hypothetical protein